MTTPFTESLEFELDTFAGDTALYAAAYRRFNRALAHNDAAAAVAAVRMVADIALSTIRCLPDHGKKSSLRDYPKLSCLKLTPESIPLMHHVFVMAARFQEFLTPPPESQKTLDLAILGWAEYLHASLERLETLAIYQSWEREV